MYEPYFDIREKLGEPMWHDKHGVPRYCKYEPGLQGVYDDFDALFEVWCQGCGRKFLVGASATGFVVGDEGPVNYVLPEDSIRWPSFVVYGDAPWHGCKSGGETMTAIPLRIVEFWRKDGPGDWERDSGWEVDFRE